MKITKKTTRIIPMLTIVYLLLLSFAPFGVCLSLVSETRVIPAGHYLTYSYNMEEDDKLDISFEVILGGNLDIDVWIVDSANYLRLQNGDSFYYKFQLERYVNYDFQFKAEDSDTYYVVFSNAFSLVTSKTVEIDIEYTPAPVINIFSVFIFGVMVFGVIVGGILIFKSLSKKNTKIEQVRKPETYQVRKIPKRQFCSNCGERFPQENTEYCPFCGEKNL